MSLQLELNDCQYEIVLSKQSHTAYIIGLATIFMFLLINFIVIGLWIKKKNETLLQICKILIKQKQLKKFNDEVTSIFNPSKKYLKRQISIDLNSIQQPNLPKYSNIDENNTQKELNESKLKPIDSILFEEVNNIQKISNHEIQLKKISKINSLKKVRDWMDSFSFYQPFLIVSFLLLASENTNNDIQTQSHYETEITGSLFLLGIICMIVSLLLYLLINCSKIFFKFLNFFDFSKAKVSPLSEESPTCNNLNKNSELRKQITTKSTKFITSNGIQTQISIHQNQLQRLKHSENIKQDHQNQQFMKQNKNTFSKNIGNLSHIFYIAYLIPLVVSILIAVINVY